MTHQKDVTLSLTLTDAQARTIFDALWRARTEAECTRYHHEQTAKHDPLADDKDPYWSGVITDDRQNEALISKAYELFDDALFDAIATAGFPTSWALGF